MAEGVLKAKFRSKKTINDIKGDDRDPMLSDFVELFQFPNQKWVRLRFVGPLVPYGGHWIDTKKKDGSRGAFWKQCLAFDADTESMDSTKECPWCDDDSEKEDAKGNAKRLVGTSNDYYTNAIIRNYQDNEPEKKRKHTEEEKESGWKDKNSDSWTPVRVIRLTRSLVRELKRLSSLNVHKDSTGEKKMFPISHKKYGVDVKIMYDKDEKTPAKKYTVQITETLKPLTEEEREYLLWKLEDLIKPAKLDKAREDHEKWLERMELGSGKKKKKAKDEDDDDEDEDTPKKKKKAKDEDDDFDEDDEDTPKKKKKKVEDEDDDEEEDDEAPKKKKKKAKDEDDDEDFNDDEDTPKKKKKVEDEEDDEEETPKKKKKTKDEDDDFDDDDEEETPKKKKKKAKDEEEDDEEETPKKKKKKAKDEEDDEDLDFDDDDEDEKPKKKKKVEEEEEDDEEETPKKKKKKAKDEDDDFDDDD
jgi:hypothetical protein